MNFSIERTSDGIHLKGELDIAGEQELMAALEDVIGTNGAVILDLAELSFIDSSGVRAIIRAADQVGESGRIVLRSPMPPVKRVFDLMRLDTIPNIEVLEE
jgi:anti-anti-sigma factor